MARINSYTTLVSAVQEAAEDTGAEFTAYIPVAIGLAEERLIKEIDLEFLDQVEINIIQGNRFVNKPAGYRLAFDVFLKYPSGLETLLIRTTDNFIRDYWPNPLEEGIPKYYSDEDQNQFYFAPTANGPYTLTVKYRKSPDSLSTANQTNFFMSKMPDALFYATMSEMMLFDRSYVQKGEWDTKYVNAVQGINNQGRRERRDDNRTPLNPEGGTNSLTGGV